MNVTNKLATLLVLFLTLGIATAAASVVSNSPDINPDYTDVSTSTDYNIHVEYDSFTSGSISDFVVVRMPGNFEKRVSAGDVVVNNPTEQVTVSVTDQDNDGERDDILVSAEDNDFSSSFTFDITLQNIDSPSSEGSYDFKVAPYDNANQGKVVTLTTKVDNTPPDKPSLSSVEAKSGGEIKVDWSSVSDSGSTKSGVDHYVVYRADTSGGTFSQEATVNSGTTYTDSSSLTDGEDYFYKVSAVDAVGNEGLKSGKGSATSDSTSPSIQSVAAEAGSKTVTVTFNENVYSDTSKSTDLKKSDFTYNDNSESGAASISSVSSVSGDQVTLTLNTAVTAGDLGSDSIQPADGEVYDDAENTASTDAENLQDTVNPTIENIQLKGEDVSGSLLSETDQGDSQTVTVTFDEPMDTSTVSGTLEAGGQSISLSLSKKDGDSSTFTGSFTISSDIEDDSATFSVSGEDQAGNALSGDYTYDTFTVDTNSPEVTLDSPTDGPLSGTVDLQKTLDSAGDGESYSWEYRINDGSWTSITETGGDWDTTQDISGEEIDVDLRVTATDDEGNTGTDSVTGLEVDNQGPTVDSGELTISLSTDTNGDSSVANPSDVIEVTWDASATEDADADTVSVTFNEFDQTVNLDAAKSGSTWTATHTVSEGTLDSTTVNADVTATDNAGNSDTGTTNDVSVDNNPPQVTTSFDGTQVLSGNSVDVASYFTPSDVDGGSTIYEYSTDGVNSWNTISTSSSWDSTGISDSSVDFRATTTDDAGNSDTATGPAIVDNTAPTITSVSISEVTDTGSNDILNASDSFKVEVDPSDSHSSVASVTVDLSSIGKSNSVSLDDEDGDGTWSKTVEVPSGHEISSYTPQVAVTDEGGNDAKDSPSSGVAIDSSAPQNPDTTSITLDPVNAANDGSVPVDVTFTNNPESGTVYVQVLDSSNNVLKTASETSNTGSTTTTVNVDLSGVTRNGESITAKSKILDDAGNVNSNGYTAESNAVTLDNDNPAVDSMSLSTTPVSDSETGNGNEVTLTVNLDENMNEKASQVSVNPDLNSDLTSTPSVENKRWADSDTFKADLQFTDDEEDTTFDVQVSGAQDTAENSINSYSEQFSINTDNPAAPTSVDFDSDYINKQNVNSAGYTVGLPGGHESGTLHVIADDGSTVKEVTQSVDQDQSSVTGSMALSTLADGQIELKAYLVDSQGNQGSTKTTSNAAEKDTVRPSDPSSITASNINEDNVGSYQVDVTLVDGYEAGTLAVKLSDSTDSTSDVTATASVSSDSDNDDTIEVTGIDASSLEQEDVTITAKFTDEAGNVNQNEFTALTTVHKDTIDPTVEGSTTLSDNKIQVNFNENMNGNTISTDDFTVSGFTVTGASEVDEDGTVELTLGSNMATGDVPQVTVEHENTLEDSYNNAIDSDINTTPTDTLAPTLSKATTVDSDGDGYIDAVDFKFGEKVTTTQGAKFKVAGYSGEAVVSDSDGNADDTVRVSFNEDTSSYDTEATPKVTVKSGAVEDTASNANQFASDTTVTSDDGAAPVLLHSEINNAESTGSATKVDLTFTEVVDVSSSATARLTNEPGELRFNSQIGETVQATYYESSSKAVLKTGDSPQTQSYSGVEDVDHYRDAGHKFDGYNAPSTSEADYVVDDDFSSSDEDSTTFNTIQKAIDAAAGESDSDIETILVRNGSWINWINVKESVKLVSKYPRGAEVGRFTVNAPDTTIQGFEIKGDGANYNGISIEPNDGATSGIVIKDNYIHGIGNSGGEDKKEAFGILAWATDSGNKLESLVVKNNLIENVGSDSANAQGFGLFIEDLADASSSEGLIVEHNTIRNIHSAVINGNNYPGVGVSVLPELTNPQASTEQSGIVTDNANAKLQANEFSSNPVDVSLAGDVSQFTSSRNNFGDGIDVLTEGNAPKDGDIGITELQSNDARSVISNGPADATGNYFGADGVNVQGDVYAFGVAPNTASNSMNTDVDTLRMSLSSGTNMVSFPINQGAKPVSEVTGGLSGVETVWTYTNGQWKEIYTGQQNDNSFKGGRGYLFNMASSDTLTVNVDHAYDQTMSNGSPSSPVSYNLTANTWNLIGSYEEFDQGTDIALKSLETPAGNDKYSLMSSTSEIKTGEAYWAFMTGDGGYANTQ
ncbi:MAG: hypothetical protein ABEJ36_01865 [Candidatus Nanosalina sp.]